MNTFDWNTKFATEFIDQFGTKIMFNPLHEKEIGSMITTYKNGVTIGGEYKFRIDNGTPFLGWGDFEFLFSPNEKGFDLFSGETVSYSFTRIE